MLAIGIFAYGRILAGTKASKDAELVEAEAAIDTAAVESFVRLKSRLTASKTLIGGHVSFSGFFTEIGKLLPTNVRFSNLDITFEQGGAKLEVDGVARNFNTLASLSSALAADGRIKDAIFSNLTINSNDNTVRFALSAKVDSKLIAYSATSAVSTSTPLRAATSTPSAATSTTPGAKLKPPPLP